MALERDGKKLARPPAPRPEAPPEVEAQASPPYVPSPPGEERALVLPADIDGIDVDDSFVSLRRAAYTSPQDEYVHSLENDGAGITLKEVARRWGKGYEWLKEQARGVVVREPGEPDRIKAGTNWREQRRNFLERLWDRKEDETIRELAKRQARIEGHFGNAADHMLTRLNRELMRRNAIDPATGRPLEGVKPIPLEVKSDLELAKYADVVNRIARRNAGMPETSKEVRGRFEFVQELVAKFIAVARRHIRTPDSLRAFAYEIKEIEAEYEKEEAPPG